MQISHKNTPTRTKQIAGFTIVELLIVIVVIGILAAITIVAYNGIQGRATDATIRSDLTNIAKHLETIKVTSATSTYPTTTELASTNKVSASKNSYEKSRNNLYYCRTTDNMNYAIGVVSTNGMNLFLVNGEIKTAAVAVWGSSTCDQLTSFGSVTGASSGYDNPTNTWAPWVK